MAIASMNLAVRYVSLYVYRFLLCREKSDKTNHRFLITLSSIGFAVFIAWLSNIFASSPAKRAVALALTNSVSSLGNMAGSYAEPLLHYAPCLLY